MFKKLLSLVAVAAICVSTQAKEVVDKYIDWTTTSWNGFVMGYIPQTSAEEGLIFEWPNFTYEDITDESNPEGYDIVNVNGTNMWVVPTEDGGPMESWGIQAHLLDGNLETEIGVAYSITVVAKANKADVTLGLPLSWDWSGGTCQGSVIVGEEWEELTCDYDEVGGASCWIVAQMYDKEARICIKSVKVFHNETDSPVAEVEWDDHLTNGDAEGEYGEIPCAYSKEYKGRNSDGSETASPEPCAIEDGVFVVHAKAVDPQAYPNVFLDENGSVKGDPQWQNQFWIQSPQEWKTNDQFRISFRYKADKPASADTQAHKQNPGDYLHWELLGSINFTTEWQEFSKEVTVSASQSGMWSAAFNLKDYTMDNTYYFDDLKWETMKLDEGWFIAGDFNGWNYAEALEMPWDEENSAYGIVVGTEENPASSVSISTKRGNDKAFKTATIKPAGELLDGEDWVEYTVSSATKISLPEPGYWYIGVDPENMQIGIMKSDEPAGFTDVISDNAAPVYYNLQGMQVKNPEAGKAYIVKRGSKVSKIYIR